MSKRILWFCDIYVQNNSLPDNRIRSCGQYFIINYSIFLSVTISLETFYKQFCPNRRLVPGSYS